MHGGVLKGAKGAKTHRKDREAVLPTEMNVQRWLSCAVFRWSQRWSHTCSRELFLLFSLITSNWVFFFHLIPPLNFSFDPFEILIIPRKVEAKTLSSLPSENWQLK